MPIHETEDTFDLSWALTAISHSFPAFRIRTVYIDTNSQEYEEAKGAKNAKTLEVRPKTTENVFLLSVSDILVRLEDNRSRKDPF